MTNLLSTKHHRIIYRTAYYTIAVSNACRIWRAQMNVSNDIAAFLLLPFTIRCSSYLYIRCIVCNVYVTQASCSDTMLQTVCGRSNSDHHESAIPSKWVSFVIVVENFPAQFIFIKIVLSCDSMALYILLTMHTEHIHVHIYFSHS